MRYIAKYSLVAAAFFGTVACTDLEEELRGDFTEKFAPANAGVGQDEGAVTDGLEAAFNRLLGGTANHGSYFSVQELSSDEAVITQKGGDWFDGGIWLTMHRHQFASTGVGGLNGAWNDTYGGILQCNELLVKGKPNPNGEGLVALTVSEAAQVRTLRAYFYWRLLDVFGNVKIAVSPGDDVPQSTRAQVYDFVVNELNAVLPDLPAGRQEYARVSQGAANALLARVYLNAQVYKGTAEYAKAIEAADRVINSGVYTLAPNFADVFSPRNTDNPEHIMIAPFDAETGTGMNFAMMTLHYPSQLTFRATAQPWNGYSTMEEFYNSFSDADKRKAASFIVGPQKDITGNPILDLAYDKADPDGAEINYTPKINELAPNGSRQAGARLGKFSFKIGVTPDMDNDYPVLRYGEVLLNKAEAIARQSGNWSDPAALAVINELRTRAGVPTYTTMTEGEFLAERGRELFQEALRRTDLIRFGAWGRAWWEKPAHNDAHKILMPIPQEQIDASKAPNKLVQNPGY
ncbi:MAG TPA: RagB/SusD family nutrient uptake outer membrane protein [Chryseosolibacter sp.]